MKRPSLISINSNISSEFLSKILLENPYLINSKDDYGNTFLSYAIKRNNQEIIDLIMALPFLDLNYKDNNDNTYLHFAVICKNIELIKQLLYLMKKKLKKEYQLIQKIKMGILHYIFPIILIQKI